MNDGDKFKKFFGFGGDSDAENKEVSSESTNEDGVEKRSTDNITEAVAAWTDKYLSLSADFQNYKKRVDLERVEWSNVAQGKVIAGLLDIIDNFERALDQERKRENAEGVAWLAGFEMIYQSLEKLLQKFDVKEMTDFSVFNPKYHEALVQVESPDHEAGQIVQVLQKGYTMNEKVIRPAVVSVAK
jgi:molecular chaperone GrpE